MLPLIVIGADERTEMAVREHVGGAPEVRFFDNTELAVYALNDLLATAVECGYPEQDTVEFDGERNAWRANVAYGPKALGFAATGQPVKLAHTGWTLVLAWDLGDPATPRRMVDNRPAGSDQPTVVWQAAPMLAANLVIDLAMANAAGLVAVLGQMKARIEP